MQRLTDAMQEDRRPGVYGWIHVAEVPLVGWSLTTRMDVPRARDELELGFGVLEIHRRERHRMEREIPGRIPGVFPLVRHRDHIRVVHVTPMRVTHLAFWGERIHA